MFNVLVRAVVTVICGLFIFACGDNVPPGGGGGGDIDNVDDIEQHSVTTFVGGSVQLHAVGHLKTGGDEDLTDESTWDVIDDHLARLDSNAVLWGVTPGKTLGLVRYGDDDHRFQITVTNAVMIDFRVEPAAATVPVGSSVDLAAYGRYSDGREVDLTTVATWTAGGSHAQVAGGRVTGMSKGAMPVRAAYGDYTAKSDVSVIDMAVTQLVITPSTSQLPLGRAMPLQAQALFSNGQTLDVTTQVAWQSMSPTIASIDASGVVAGLAVGGSEIHASLGGATTSAHVDVTNALLEGLEVTPASVTLGSGTSTQLVATGVFSDGIARDLTSQVSWSTDAPAKATVAAGLVLGGGAGTAHITATSGALTASSEITITSSHVVSIAVSAPSPTLPVGSTMQLTATATMSDGSTQDVTATASWSSDHPLLIAMASGGEATALLPGTAVVNATVGTITGSRTLEATAAVLVAIDLAPAALSLALGTSQAVVATGRYSDGSTLDLTASAIWTSTISAIAAPTTTLVRDQLMQLTATAHYSDGSTADITAQASWGASTGNVAVSNAVGSVGRAVAVAHGTATLTATLSGIVGTQPVTVAVGGCHVVINEVKTGGLILTRDEFVELYNPCSFGLDLSRTRLIHHLLLGIVDISLGDLQGTLSAGGYRLYGGTAFVGIVDGSILTDLGQLGGGLGLRNVPSGQLVDSMGWGVTLGDLVEGVVGIVLPSGSSLSRIPNGQDTNNNGADFQVRTPTPRTAN
jgi:trimeric autotransporter adhesin